MQLQNAPRTSDHVIAAILWHLCLFSFFFFVSHHSRSLSVRIEQAKQSKWTIIFQMNKIICPPVQLHGPLPREKKTDIIASKNLIGSNDTDFFFHLLFLCSAVRCYHSFFFIMQTDAETRTHDSRLSLSIVLLIFIIAHIYCCSRSSYFDIMTHSDFACFRCFFIHFYYIIILFQFSSSSYY